MATASSTVPPTNGTQNDESVPNGRAEERKRHRADEDEKDPLDFDDDAYVQYVPLKQRRMEKMSKLQRHVGRPTNEREATPAEEEEAATAGPRANVSLIDQAAELKKKEAGGLIKIKLSIH